MKRARFQHITADTRLRSRWSLPQIALRNLGHLQNITPHIPHLQCQTANTHKRTFMPKNPTLHLESIIPSYLTACPSRDLVVVAPDTEEVPDIGEVEDAKQ